MENHDILLFTSRRKLILTNVYDVPDVRKNLTSTNSLCKNGLKAVLEAEKIILSKNGVFVGQGYLYNGMFKLSINKVNGSVYMLESNFYLCHTRLSHMNFKSIKLLVRTLARIIGRLICTAQNTETRIMDVELQCMSRADRTRRYSGFRYSYPLQGLFCICVFVVQYLTEIRIDNNSGSNIIVQNIQNFRLMIL